MSFKRSQEGFVFCHLLGNMKCQNPTVGKKFLFFNAESLKKQVFSNFYQVFTCPLILFSNTDFETINTDYKNTVINQRIL